MQLSQIPSIEMGTYEQRCCDKVRDKATPRQLEVLDLFGEHLTPQQVADRLGISIKTVHAHTTKIYEYCRDVWELAPNKKLTYFFLHNKFAKVEEAGKGSIQPQLRELSVEERNYCDWVIAKATPCQLKVLRLFGDGLTPQEVAKQRGRSIKTIDTHKTKLLAFCRKAWKLDKPLDYHFLNEKFAAFFSHAKQKTPNAIE